MARHTEPGFNETAAVRPWTLPIGISLPATNLPLQRKRSGDAADTLSGGVCCQVRQTRFNETAAVTPRTPRAIVFNAVTVLELQ